MNEKADEIEMNASCSRMFSYFANLYRLSNFFFIGCIHTVAKCMYYLYLFFFFTEITLIIYSLWQSIPLVILHILKEPRFSQELDII